MSAHDPWLERLSEYLDGELGPAEQEACPRTPRVARAAARPSGGHREARAHAHAPPLPPRVTWPGVARELARPRR
jgi:hypothetical protein